MCQAGVVVVPHQIVGGRGGGRGRIGRGGQNSGAVGREKRLGNQTQQCQHCQQLFVRNREESYTVLDLIYLLSMKTTLILTLKLNKKHLETSIFYLN